MRGLLLLFLLASFSTKAQVCSGPGRTPQTAIPVCGTLVFPQSNVPSCSAGNIAQNGCSLDPVTSSNSVWYKFHCYQSGTLGFLIAPASGSDDYDWALMNITGRQPQAVLTTNLVVSLNISGFTGNTGCTATGTGDVNCAGNTSQFNRMPQLVAGNDYLLMVTNWSNSGLGYDLAFSGGTAQITNNLPPAITSVGITGCNSSVVNIALSEDILCNSLTATGSEFTISNGSHVFTTVSSACTGGGSTFTTLSIGLQTPLPPGNYQLTVNNGTDGNTLKDVCQESLPVGASFPFTIPVLGPLQVTGITYSGCSPSVLRVEFNKPVKCNSITATGSEFMLGTGSNPVISVTSACNSGNVNTNSILVQMQNPMPFGNYMLTINNGTDGNTLIDTCGIATATGYQFPFSINQVTAPPAIDRIDFDPCKPYLVTVNFATPVSCASISSGGSEFTVSPGALTVTDVSYNCSPEGITSKVILTLSGNLPAGNFSVNIANGTDGNTVSDSCFSFMPNTVQPFVTTQAPRPVIDSLQFDKCEPSSIKIFYSQPIKCSSIDPAGSEFLVTGPASVTISSVSTDATCSAGYSRWLMLHLSQPITTFGSYTIHNQAGVDGNSVMDTCYALQNTSEIKIFNVLGRPSAVFQDEVHWGCVNDTIRLSHPGGNGVNQWRWEFSDGTIDSGKAVTHIFPVSTITASVRLVVSNGECADTLTRTYTLDNAIVTNFTISQDTICLNNSVTFINTTTGRDVQYTWDLGNNIIFAGNAPPAHTYTSVGTFPVRLIATNIYGCRDTSDKKIEVAGLPLISFSGLLNKYCTGDAVALTSHIQGNISSYTWDNGNGQTFLNQPAINFNYSTEKNYVVKLTAIDRFCGPVSVDASTMVFRLPVFNLGADKILCPGLSVKIGVPVISGYAYLWNNGSGVSEITTALQTNTYSLEINNNGCVARDEILVTVLENCLIKVPNAFTPNRDGLNDYLKAINADLATKFLFRVYNRFGQLLFSSTDPLRGWDGRFKGIPLSTSTYVWQLSYVDPVSKKPVYEKGSSILIR